MRRFAGILIIVLFSFFFTPAQALESKWVSADHIQVRLVTGGFHPAYEDFTLIGGLEVRLTGGWHAYWRTPGDAGLPPVFGWDESSNIEIRDLGWPLPKRYEETGLHTFGYDKHVLFPFALHLKDRAQPAVLTLKMEMMVCNEICVPQSVSVSLNVPFPHEPDRKYDAVLVKAFETLPAKSGTPALKIESAVIGPEAVVVDAFSQTGFEKADLFVETGAVDDVYVTSPPEMIMDNKDPRKAMLRIAAPQGVDNLAKALGDTDITLTLTNGRQAVEKTISFKE